MFNKFSLPFFLCTVFLATYIIMNITTIKVQDNKLYSHIPIGAYVRPGKDWCWKRQHGEIGQIIGVYDKKGNWVVVKWINGYTNAYRWGAGGKFDLDIIA